MFKYAQIDETGCCISVSYLSKEQNQPNMISLNDNQDVQAGDILSGGTWTRPEPQPPAPSEVDTLKSEVTFLKQRDARMQDDINAIIEGLTGGV